MELEKLQQITKDILSKSSDAAAVSEYLTTITEDNKAIVSQLQTLTTEKEQLSKDNESLRKVNMDLFLKVGTQKPTFNNAENQQIQQQEDTKLEFSALFDANGNLK